MGGENSPTNKIRVCDTGHYNIHRIMKVLYLIQLAKEVGGVPGVSTVPGTATEKALAKAGLEDWNADGKPGKFVFEFHPDPHLEDSK